MAFIQNNNGPINIENQLNITNTPPNTQGEQEQEQEQEDSKDRLSIRQAVIMMTYLLGVSLDPKYTCISGFARLISQITVYSENSIRNTITEYSKGEKETQTTKDSKLVADLIKQFNPEIAEKILRDVDF